MLIVLRIMLPLASLMLMLHNGKKRNNYASVKKRNHYASLNQALPDMSVSEERF